MHDNSLGNLPQKLKKKKQGADVCVTVITSCKKPNTLRGCCLFLSSLAQEILRVIIFKTKHAQVFALNYRPLVKTEPVQCSSEARKGLQITDTTASDNIALTFLEPIF